MNHWFRRVVLRQPYGRTPLTQKEQMRIIERNLRIATFNAWVAIVLLIALIVLKINH